MFFTALISTYFTYLRFYKREMTISGGKIEILVIGAVIAAVVILTCCFLKNGKNCRPRQQTEETEQNESSLEREQAQDSLNGHIPLPGFGFGSTLPVKFCTIYTLRRLCYIDSFVLN